MSHTEPDRWLTRQDLRDVYHIGTANMTLKRWEQQGRFPRRHIPEDGAPRWAEREIVAWLRGQRSTA